MNWELVESLLFIIFLWVVNLEIPMASCTKLVIRASGSWFRGVSVVCQQLPLDLSGTFYPHQPLQAVVRSICGRSSIYHHLLPSPSFPSISPFAAARLPPISLPLAPTSSRLSLLDAAPLSSLLQSLLPFPPYPSPFSRRCFVSDTSRDQDLAKNSARSRGKENHGLNLLFPRDETKSKQSKSSLNHTPMFALNRAHLFGSI